MAVVLAGAGLASAEPRPAQLIIWGGGENMAEAQAALARWQERAKANEWDGLLKVAEGYPRIVPSNSVPGLKPGFVVVLGACEPSAAPKVLETVKAFEAEAYAHTVTWAQPLACPQLGPTWRVLKSRSWKKAEGMLTAVVLERLEKEDLPDSSFEQSVRVTLRAPDGRHLGSDERSGHPTGAIATGETGFRASLDAAGPTVTSLFYESGCGTQPDVIERRVKYSVENGRLAPQVSTVFLENRSAHCDP
ncbi:hypothetical protein [Myxococcus qinghaiensis]|uniref:hypothetical protein n=1 Tax=Myxococcus qinghaiensis TaxID=2906758 RepID=UPI0020A82EB2|nr:hypothetical protein [Myxococcus qinghaiensis]MCP3162164.1 hypothetical protein [Myxococcus qinghaiensis]